MRSNSRYQKSAASKRAGSWYEIKGLDPIREVFSAVLRLPAFVFPRSFSKDQIPTCFAWGPAIFGVLRFQERWATSVLLPIAILSFDLCEKFGTMTRSR